MALRVALLAVNILQKNNPPESQLVDDFLNIEGNQLFNPFVEAKRDGKTILLNSILPDGSTRELTIMRNFSSLAHTMIGSLRLDDIHHCLDMIIKEDIKGDLIETGVWRGGATIFMRGYLAAHRIEDRRVWVADSFEGLPKPVLAPMPLS